MTVGKRKKGLYRPGWHNILPFDTRTPIDGQLSLWVRRDGDVFTLGPGTGHVPAAVEVTGIRDDEEAAFDALFHAGEARAFVSRSGAYASIGASFVGVPTPAQVRSLGEMHRANGGASFTWSQHDTDGNRLDIGRDWRSFVAATSAMRGELPNPSLWTRLPADLDARIRAYRTHTDDVDEFYYHVTTATNARGVLSGGLRPHGRSTMDDGFYRSYSAGKVFVTELGGVRFWMSRVEDHLESQGRWSPTSKLVILRALKSDIGDVEHDEFGSRDARAAAYQATRDLGRVERRKRTN